MIAMVMDPVSMVLAGVTIALEERIAPRPIVPMTAPERECVPFLKANLKIARDVVASANHCGADQTVANQPVELGVLETRACVAADHMTLSLPRRLMKCTIPLAATIMESVFLVLATATRTGRATLVISHCAPTTALEMDAASERTQQRRNRLVLSSAGVMRDGMELIAPSQHAINLAMETESVSKESVLASRAMVGHHVPNDRSQCSVTVLIVALSIALVNARARLKWKGMLLETSVLLVAPNSALIAVELGTTNFQTTLVLAIPPSAS